jgi:hypothetical protein
MAKTLPFWQDQATCTHQQWIPYAWWAAQPPVGNQSQCTKLMCQKCGLIISKKDGSWIQISE